MGMSVHEPTWDKERKAHTCCGSTHSYHKTSCPIRREQQPIDDRTANPNFAKVQEMKYSGMTSGDVARWLGLELEEVNSLWVI